MRGSRFLTRRFERASGASLEAARRIVDEFFRELFDGKAQTEETPEAKTTAARPRGSVAGDRQAVPGARADCS